MATRPTLEDPAAVEVTRNANRAAALAFLSAVAGVALLVTLPRALAGSLAAAAAAAAALALLVGATLLGRRARARLRAARRPAPHPAAPAVPDDASLGPADGTGGGPALRRARRPRSA